MDRMHARSSNLIVRFPASSNEIPLVRLEFEVFVEVRIFDDDKIEYQKVLQTHR